MVLRKVGLKQVSPEDCLMATMMALKTLPIPQLTNLLLQFLPRGGRHPFFSPGEA